MSSIASLTDFVSRDEFYLTVYLYLDRSSIAALKSCCRLFNQKVNYQKQPDLFLMQVSREDFSIKKGIKRNYQLYQLVRVSDPLDLASVRSVIEARERCLEIAQCHHSQNLAILQWAQIRVAFGR